MTLVHPTHTRDTATQIGHRELWLPLTIVSPSATEEQPQISLHQTVGIEDRRHHGQDKPERLVSELIRRSHDRMPTAAAWERMESAPTAVIRTHTDTQIEYVSFATEDDDTKAIKRLRLLAHAAKVTMGAAVLVPESGPSPSERPRRSKIIDPRNQAAAKRLSNLLQFIYSDEYTRHIQGPTLSYLTEQLCRANSAATPVPLKSQEENGLIPTESPTDSHFKLVRRPVLRISQRAARWAARLLPANDRERYCCEYLSELYELAQSDSPIRAQFLYGLRALVRAPLLRLALSRPPSTVWWRVR